MLIRRTDNEEGNRNGGCGGRGKVGLRNQRICKGSGDFELKLNIKKIQCGETGLKAIQELMGVGGGGARWAGSGRKELEENRIISWKVHLKSGSCFLS